MKNDPLERFELEPVEPNVLGEPLPIGPRIDDGKRLRLVDNGADVEDAPEERRPYEPKFDRGAVVRGLKVGAEERGTIIGRAELLWPNWPELLPP